MTDRLRTVTVGFGQVAEGLADDTLMARHFPCATHAQALRLSPDFRWDAVVDHDEAALARARERWGIAIAVRDASELPRDARFDVAVLATPPAERLRTLDRLPGLRAAVVEKPLGLNLAQAERFAARARSRGIVAQVNYWRRFDTGCERVKALALGAPQAAVGVYGRGLRNNGSHLIDLARLMLGEVAEARALQAPRPVAEAPIAGDADVAFALKLRDSLPSYRGSAKFSTWLYRVVTNVARMHVRHERSRPRLGGAPEGLLEARPDHAATPDEEVARNVRLRALYRHLDALSEKKRTVLALHDLAGVSAADVAEIVEAPVLTVRTRLFYARKELYAALAADPELEELLEQLQAARGGGNRGAGGTGTGSAGAAGGSGG